MGERGGVEPTKRERGRDREGRCRTDRKGGRERLGERGGV